MLLISISLITCSDQIQVEDEEFTSKIVKLEVDESGNVLDTVMVKYHSYYENGTQKKNRSISIYGDVSFTSDQIFDEDGELIYRISKYGRDSSFSEFKVYKNGSGIIERATMIDAVGRESNDTLTMNYAREYEESRLKNLLITSDGLPKNENYSKTVFNSEEYKISNLVVSRGEVLTSENWEYNDNNNILRLIRDSYITDSVRTISEFENDKIIREIKINLTSNQEIYETVYEYDKLGELRRSVETNNPEQKKRYFKFE